MRLCEIYCIENIITGKKYIGQSVDIKRRWREHLRELKQNKHPNQHLQFAFNKYKEDNFEFKILLICEHFELTRCEQFFVDYYTPELLYNICVECVDSRLAVSPSDEIREKMSKTCIEKGIGRGKNNPFYGKQHSRESREKMSISRSGEGHHMYGKHHSKETRNKISKSLIGNVLSETTRNKISNVLRGENNPNAKLTKKDVLEIKKLLKECKLLQREIAELYNVKRPLIGNIKNGRAWKHLHDIEEEVQDDKL